VSTPESRIIVTADVTKVSEGFARVEADATRLTGALGKISRDGFKGLENSARQSIGVLEGRLNGLTSVVTRVAGALALLGGGGAVFTYLRNVVNELDALNDAADATGASIENLSALENIGRRVGTSFDTVSGILVRFNAQLEAAGDPGSNAAQALQAIGLSAEELRQQDPAEALQRVAQALTGYADDANKARLVQVLFGKSVREAAPFLKDLADAGQLNARVTAEQAQEAERFNKALAGLQADANDLARTLTSALLPAVNRTVTELRDGVDVFGSFSGALVGVGLGTSPFEGYAEGIQRVNEKIAELSAELADVERRASNPNVLGRLFGVDGLTALAEELKGRIEQQQKIAEFLRLRQSRSVNQADYSNEGRTGGTAATPSINFRPEANAGSARAGAEARLQGGSNVRARTRSIGADGTTELLRDFQRQQQEAARFSEQLLDQTAQINVSLITNDRARGEAQIELDRRVMQERLTMLKLTGVDTDAAQQALNANIVARQRALTEALKPEWQRLLEEWNNTTEAMAKSYDNLMTGVVVRTEDALADFLRTGKLNIDSLADYVSDAIARMMAQQAIAGIGNFISLMTTGFAKGGAFGANGQITAFADGGVVSRPTFFGYAGGRMGLMGEAGPEAVMPLTRGPDGKLGVQTHGGSQPLNVTINAQSGITRAELAAMLPGIKEQLKAELVGSMRRPGFAG
jgi:lambda family phage tail tape measure protein